MIMNANTLDKAFGFFHFVVIRENRDRFGPAYYRFEGPSLAFLQFEGHSRDCIRRGPRLAVQFIS